MKINIISDLHCRNTSFPPSFDIDSLEPADALVVAGDLGTRANYSKMLGKIISLTVGKFKEVIVVKGNHDYYVTDPGSIDKHGRPKPPSSAGNYVVTFDDRDGTPVDFICTTLWSPIANDEIVRYSMNDYHLIPGFTTELCTQTFWANLDWLEEQMGRSNDSKHKAVVVTHHLPLPDLIDPRYAGDPINEAFCVMNKEGEARIRKLKPALWIHGHSHNFLDAEIDGVRYVRNPYGYEWASHNYGTYDKEQTDFRKNFIVEI